MHNVPCDSLLDEDDFLSWSSNVDGEFNSISHVWTLVIVSNGFSPEETVRVHNFLVIKPQEHSC